LPFQTGNRVTCKIMQLAAENGQFRHNRAT
jgi:hypothetical protein